MHTLCEINTVRKNIAMLSASQFISDIGTASYISFVNLWLIQVFKDSALVGTIVSITEIALFFLSPLITTLIKGKNIKTMLVVSDHLRALIMVVLFFLVGHINAVMIVSIFIFTASLVMAVIYPLVIAPLFNKFMPLEDGELKNRIEALSSSLGFKLSGIFIMDESKRSGHSNAYFGGLGKSKRIVLFDTLVESYINKNGYVRFFDETVQAPWLFNGSTFLSYDDEASCRAKAEFLKKEGLAGIMFWEYGLDKTHTLTQVLREALDAQ